MGRSGGKQAASGDGPSEAGLRAILDTIPALVWATRADGTAEFVNRRWEEYTGLGLERALGWGWTAAVHPEDRNRVVEYWQSLLSSGRAGEVEGRLRRHDGAYRWFLFRGNPLRDAAGTVVKWCGTSTDIEEQKRAHQALIENVEDLRLVLDGIPGLVYTMTPEVGLELANSRVMEYFGRTFEELKQWDEIGVVHPDDMPRVRASLQRTMELGQPHEVQQRLRRADGSWRWFQPRTQAQRDANGRIVRWYGVLFDIEDLRRAEDALRAMQARLSRATQVATVGELAASIAHEVNQPLAAVVANAHACLRWLGAEPPNVAQAREAAQRIARDGRDAGEVVQRVRSLFKRGSAARVALDMQEVVGEVLHLLEREAGRQRVIIETEFAAGLPPVHGDRVQLQQLVLNLLLNGMEAMATVADRPRQLVLRARPDAGGVRFDVQDSGPGLADPEKAFEPFYTTKQDGMGMGLAICRSIIEAHEGRLWVADGPGPGATVCFTLPTAPAA